MPDDGHIQKTIDTVMWGAHFCSVMNSHGESVLLVLKSPSLKDRNFIEFIYQEALDEAHSLGIVSEFEFRNKLKIKQIWDETQDQAIELTVERIRELEDNLKKLKGASRQRRMTEKLINSHTKTLQEELARKAQLFCITAEQYAGEARSKAIVFCCAYDELENKYWNSWTDFLNECDIQLIANIVGQINKISNLGTKDIREVARSPEWRYLWNAAKGNIKSVFDCGVGDFSIDQKNLVYWSQVYDSVYEAYERPSEETINDDDALDKWFEEQSVKRKQEEVENTGNIGKGVKISDRVARHGEIFVVTNPDMNPDTIYRQKAPVTPDIQDVEGLNSNFVRTFKRKEQETIKEKKTITEKRLRTRENKIARKLIGSQDAVISKRNLGGKATGKDKILPGGTL